MHHSYFLFATLFASVIALPSKNTEVSAAGNVIKRDSFCCAFQTGVPNPQCTCGTPGGNTATDCIASCGVSVETLLSTNGTFTD